MATFVLLPGAGSDSWYWHLVAPGLKAAGHDVVGVDFPVADDACGLAEYAAVAIETIGPRADLTVVAQSMAAFTAPMIAAEVPVDLIVLVAPMVPAPGESPGDWWANTRQPQAARSRVVEEGRQPEKAFDPVEIFLHDVDPAIAADSANHVRAQSATPFKEPWPLERWPRIPTRCVIGLHDRLFPPDFQRRVIRERLGVTPDEMESGHLPALSQPAELTRRLLTYREDWEYGEDRRV